MPKEDQDDALAAYARDPRQYRRQLAEPDEAPAAEAEPEKTALVKTTGKSGQNAQRDTRNAKRR
jgi:hypothetical protein